jgi:hypothetical protein
VTDVGVKRAVQQFSAVMKTQHIERPDIGEAVTWDMMLIIVDALRHRGTNATSAEIRDYINGIRAWPGIFGRMDFQASPQRGVLPETANLVRWNPDAARWFAVTKPGGAPLK